MKVWFLHVLHGIEHIHVIIVELGRTLNSKVQILQRCGRRDFERRLPRPSRMEAKDQLDLQRPDRGVLNARLATFVARLLLVRFIARSLSHIATVAAIRVPLGKTRE